MNQVTTSAPGKLILYGDHSAVYGYPCVVTAVDQRLSISVTKTSLQELRVTAPDVQIDNYVKSHTQLGVSPVPRAVSFIENLYHIFLSKYPQTTGIAVTTHSQFSQLFGFGSSSAVTVGLAAALNELYQLNLSKKALFDLCYEAVLAVQGVGSGFDLAAAIWGGTIYFTKGAQIVTPLAVKNLPLVIGYTGIKADTSILINKVKKLYQTQPDRVKRIFEEMAALVNGATHSLEAQDFMQAGKIMNQAQALLSQLGVSSQKLDTMNSAAITAGAWGAKLSGAGVGDCMIALADPHKHAQIAEAITAAGGTFMSVKTAAEGVRVESASA